MYVLIETSLNFQNIDFAKHILANTSAYFKLSKLQAECYKLNISSWCTRSFASLLKQPLYRSSYNSDIEQIIISRNNRSKGMKVSVVISNLSRILSDIFSRMCLKHHNFPLRDILLWAFRQHAGSCLKPWRYLHAEIHWERKP